MGYAIEQKSLFAWLLKFQRNDNDKQKPQITNGHGLLFGGIAEPANVDREAISVSLVSFPVVLWQGFFFYNGGM